MSILKDDNENVKREAWSVKREAWSVKRGDKNKGQRTKDMPVPCKLYFVLFVIFHFSLFTFHFKFFNFRTFSISSQLKNK